MEIAPVSISAAPVSLDLQGVRVHAQAFLEQLLGPVARESGMLLHDAVRGWRLKNQLRALAKTQELLQEAGIDPRQVPFGLLCRILEGASLAEDDNFRDMWASLLANAAAPDAETRVHPSFAQIMLALSPIDARILNYFAQTSPAGTAIPDRQYYFSRQVIPALGTGADAYDLALENLVRLGLCHWSEVQLPSWRDSRHLESGVQLTTLGKTFLSACMPPGFTFPE